MSVLSSTSVENAAGTFTCTRQSRNDLKIRSLRATTGRGYLYQMLAGVGCGMFANLEEAARMQGAGTAFEPAMTRETRTARLIGWKRAVESVID